MVSPDRQPVNDTGREPLPPFPCPPGEERSGGRGGWSALLVLGTILAYLPAFFGDFIWDDDAYVAENRTLRSPAGLAAIWFDITATPQYYPLVHTTYWIEYRLWGLNAAGYHVTNVLLHAANAVLLWRVLCFLSVPGAWFATAVFALHPVHVESVAWITERKNVLSAFFYLASGLCYLRFALPPTRSVSDGRTSLTLRVGNIGSQVLYITSVLLFVGALLSKTVTATLPAALALILWWKRGLRRQDWLMLAPMFILGVSFGVLTAWLERTHVGARGSDFDFSFIERCLIAGKAVWFYLWKLLWPVNLTFMYPRWDIDASEWWQYLFPATAVALLVALWLLRRRLGRGPLLAALYFGGTLFPALGFANVYPMRFSFVADHFQYLASIGPIVLFAAFAARFQTGCIPVGTTSARRDKPGGSLRINVLSTTAALALLGLLGALTWSQCLIYLGLETLWEDTVRKNPRAFLAHVALGRIHQQNAAIAIELEDQDTSTAELERATQHYQAAIEANPRFWEAYYGLGVVQKELKHFGDAVANLEKAIAIEPNYPDHRDVLGNLLLERGQEKHALIQFEAMLRLNAKSAAAHYGIARALAAQGQFEEARRHAEDALQIDPELLPARELLRSFTSKGK